MELLEALGLVVTGILGVWAIYQTYITSRLNQQLHKFNLKTDQSIQQLYRAREATIERHKAAIYLSEFNRMRKELKDETPQFPNDVMFQKFAEFSAHWAELRGLAFAIGDSELLSAVNETKTGSSSDENTSQSLAHMLHEMNYRGQSQRIHTRISQLLLEATSTK